MLKVRYSVLTAAMIATAIPGAARAQAEGGEVECSECKECVVRPSWYMFELVIAVSNPDWWEGDFTEWGCFEFDCSDPPIPCDIYSDDEPATSVRLLALATADMKPAERELLRSRLKGKAIFVPERSAVQIVGCKGVVIGHLPLTSARAAALELLSRQTVGRISGVPAHSRT